MSSEKVPISEHDQSEIDKYMATQQQEEAMMDLEYEDFISTLPTEESAEEPPQQQPAPSRSMHHPDEYLFDMQGNLIQAPTQEAFVNWSMAYPLPMHQGAAMLPYQYPPAGNQPGYYSAENLEQMMAKMGVYSQPGMPAAPLHPTGGQPVNICKYFPNCKFGNSCKFYHPYPVAGAKQEGFVAPLDEQPAANARQATGNRAHIPLHRQTCRYFPNCMYGESCLFYHPTFGAAGQPEQTDE